MATEYLFDFYSVLVENVFGSVGLAIIGVAAVIFLILAICRSSMTLIVYWLMFYALIMATFYVGTLGLLFAWIFSGTYLAYAILRTWRTDN